MLNKIFIMGRLTADPELRRTQSGVAVASFSLACDRDFKTKAGETETDFINVIAWKKTAEFVCKFFTQGRSMVVVGRLQIRPYTDKQGNKRKATEIVADNIYFCDSKSDGDNIDNGNTGTATPAPATGEFRELGEEDDGELPF